MMKTEGLTRHALTRMAHEILERNRGLDEIALVGIRTRGVPLARRISRSLHDINGDAFIGSSGSAAVAGDGGGARGASRLRRDARGESDLE